jgi:putative membrane protein
MNSALSQLFMRWAILALGVMLATKLGIGIRCDSGSTLLVVVVLLSFFNAILKPLMVLFTLPFILLTLGLGMVVINALLFLLVARLVDGFYVASFWSAMWAALVLGLINMLVKPLFVLLTLPITIVTVGLFLFVINALMFWLAGSILKGFQVNGFWWAVGGALLYSLISGFLTNLINK